VHHRLDGFRNEPEDPPLRMHSALAAGDTRTRPREHLSNFMITLSERKNST
jgi:hypothetical protein